MHITNVRHHHPHGETTELLGAAAYSYGDSQLPMRGGISMGEGLLGQGPAGRTWRKCDYCAWQGGLVHIPCMARRLHGEVALCTSHAYPHSLIAFASQHEMELFSP